MFSPEPLPRTLFEEIGKIVALWAVIEQDIMLQTSALASFSTGGKTTDYLRLEFKRLRKEWLKVCRLRFPRVTVNKIVMPLNEEMAKRAEDRGNIVHGMWTHTGRGKFRLTMFEQKGQLVRYENDLTLNQIKQIRAATYLLSKRVHSFTTGQDGVHNGPRPILKTIAPVIPKD